MEQCRPGEAALPGHYQPHLPADLGFYDLRVPETREAQAELAQTYGITGFCYYHYWFNGRRLLKRPFDEVLHRRPAAALLPVLGQRELDAALGRHESRFSLQQQYSPEEIGPIEHLIMAFSDDRYIKIDGRPLFLVYRTCYFQSRRRLRRSGGRRAGRRAFQISTSCESKATAKTLTQRPSGLMLPSNLRRIGHGCRPEVSTRKMGYATARYHELQKAGLMSKAYAITRSTPTGIE